MNEKQFAAKKAREILKQSHQLGVENDGIQQKAEDIVEMAERSQKNDMDKDKRKGDN